MIKKMLAALCAFVLAFSLAPSAPATAAASDCPNGKFCTWVNNNYGGTRWEWSPGTIVAQPNGCLTVTASARNVMSSLYNRAGLVNVRMRIWTDTNCSGSSTEITTSEMDADLNWSPNIVSFGDTMESISVRP